MADIPCLAKLKDPLAEDVPVSDAKVIRSTKLCPEPPPNQPKSLLPVAARKFLKVTEPLAMAVTLSEEYVILSTAEVDGLPLPPPNQPKLLLPVAAIYPTVLDNGPLCDAVFVSAAKSILLTVEVLETAIDNQLPPHHP